MDEVRTIYLSGNIICSLGHIRREISIAQDENRTVYASVQNSRIDSRNIKTRFTQKSLIHWLLFFFNHRRFNMIKKIFMPLLAMLVLASTGVLLGGCNTVEGAGKDIQKGGEAIKDEASEHKNY